MIGKSERQKTQRFQVWCWYKTPCRDFLYGTGPSTQDPLPYRRSSPQSSYKPIFGHFWSHHTHSAFTPKVANQLLTKSEPTMVPTNRVAHPIKPLPGTKYGPTIAVVTFCMIINPSAYSFWRTIC